MDAVVYGRLSFIVTIPFSRRNSTFRPLSAISRKFKWHRTLNEHTTLLMTISISGSGSTSSVTCSSVKPLFVNLSLSCVVVGTVKADDVISVGLIAATQSFNGFGIVVAVVVGVAVDVDNTLWCGCRCGG